MKGLTITIFEASEGGYMYDIWAHDHTDCEPDRGCDSVDGGLCTTTLENALGMAYVQANRIIEVNKDPEICRGSCGEKVSAKIARDGGVNTDSARTVMHHAYGICHYGECVTCEPKDEIHAKDRIKKETTSV